MRYLKRFNENFVHLYEEIKETIEDILIPISDMGYKIETWSPIESTLSNYYINIKVVSFGERQLKMNDEVKDEFIRMNDYLESLGFLVEVNYVDQSLRSMTNDFSKFITNDCVLRQLRFIAKK
jgi:hypothetical protein